MSTLNIQAAGHAFDAAHAILRQIGWVGHKNGAVYALGERVSAFQEPGGFSPLYIQVGTYVFDEDGNKMWRD